MTNYLTLHTWPYKNDFTFMNLKVCFAELSSQCAHFYTIISTMCAVLSALKWSGLFSIMGSAMIVSQNKNNGNISAGPGQSGCHICNNIQQVTSLVLFSMDYRCCSVCIYMKTGPPVCNILFCKWLSIIYTNSGLQYLYLYFYDSI